MKNNIFTTIILALAMIFTFNTVSNAQFNIVPQNNDKITEYIYKANDSFMLSRTIENNDTTFHFIVPCDNRYSKEQAVFTIGKTKQEAIHQLQLLSKTLEELPIYDDRISKITIIDDNSKTINIIKSPGLKVKQIENSKLNKRFISYGFSCNELPGSSKSSNYFRVVNAEYQSTIDKIFDYYIKQLDKRFE